MRVGSWPDVPVRTTTARAFLSGVEHDVDEISLTSEMTPELPVVGGGQVAVTDGTVQWPQRSVVATTTPHPFVRPAGSVWPPPVATPVRLEVGDGRGQWWQQHTGLVDSSTGDVNDPQVSSKVIDWVDRFSVKLHQPSLLGVMPALEEGGPTRRVGLIGTYVTDLCARAARFCATPPFVTGSRLSVPCMGSLWPELGVCVEASEWNNPASGPSWQRTPYGVAAKNAGALWQLSTAHADTSYSLMVCLADQRITEHAQVDVFDNDTGQGLFLRHEGTGDLLVAGWLGGQPLISVPRSGADRAVLAVSWAAGVGTLTLHTVAGVAGSATVSGAATVPTHARLGGAGAMGAVQVNPVGALTPLTYEATAIIRVGEVQRLYVMPALRGEAALSILTGQARAESASMWLDSTGRFRYVSRGLLEFDPVRATKTTELHVDQFGWVDDLSHVREQVTLTYRTAAVSLSNRTNVPIAEPTEETLEAGQSTEVWLDPGADQEWFGVDTSLAPIADTSLYQKFTIGSYRGGAVVTEGNQETTEVWASDDHLTVTLAPVGDVFKLTQTAHTLPVGTTLMTRTPADAPNLPLYLRGRALPLIRGKARVEWTSQSDTYTTGATSAVASYEHDCSWYVQDPARLVELADWLVAALGKPNPTLTSIEIDPDPRLELGDKVTIEDPHRTGLSLDLVITGITQSWGGDAPSMSLTGRVTRIRQAWTVRDPVSSWDALLTAAGWPEGGN